MSSSDEASASSQSTDSPPPHRVEYLHCERLAESVSVHHRENGEGGDGACCDCVRLMKSVKVLERALADREREIAQLREENRRQAAELLEIQLREVRKGVHASEKG